MPLSEPRAQPVPQVLIQRITLGTRADRVGATPYLLSLGTVDATLPSVLSTSLMTVPTPNANGPWRLTTLVLVQAHIWALGMATGPSVVHSLWVCLHRPGWSCSPAAPHCTLFLKGQDLLCTNQAHSTCLHPLKGCSPQSCVREPLPYPFPRAPSLPWPT